jgi:hypothetical protein
LPYRPPGSHNWGVTKPVLVALCIASFGPVAAVSAAAQGIVRSQDAQGHPYYSNRSGDGASQSAPAPRVEGDEQGWESVLERRQGQADAEERAEAAINSLELQVTRKKREREHAQEELEATQADLVRALQARSSELPTLKARETTQATALRKIDIELGLMKLQIAKLRALKEAERQRQSAP